MLRLAATKLLSWSTSCAPQVHACKCSASPTSSSPTGFERVCVTRDLGGRCGVLQGCACCFAFDVAQGPRGVWFEALKSCACTNICMYIYIYPNLYLYLYIFMYIHKHIHACIHRYIHAHMHIYIYTHKHIYMNIYAYVYMCKYECM